MIRRGGDTDGVVGQMTIPDRIQCPIAIQLRHENIDHNHIGRLLLQIVKSSLRVFYPGQRDLVMGRDEIEQVSGGGVVVNEQDGECMLGHRVLQCSSYSADNLKIVK